MDPDSLYRPGAADHLNEAHSHQSQRTVALVQKQETSPASPAEQPAPIKMQPNEAAGYLMLASDHWAQLRQQCEFLVESRALHSSYDTPGKAMMVGLKGIEMGIPLSAAWSGMRIIDGEVTILGKLGLRLIYQRIVSQGGICDKLPVPLEDERKRAGWRMARPGQEPQEFWFTMEDAERAGLLRMYSNRKKEWIDTPAYKKYPDRMLSWRALAKGASYLFQDVLQGCMLTEEMSHKDREFLDAQAVEATADERAPTFHQGAPKREEVGRDHPDVRMVGELVDEYCRLYVELHPPQPESDTTPEAWYKEVRHGQWQKIVKRCVRNGYTAPTQDEARTMQTVMKQEIGRLKKDIRDREAEQAVEKGERERQEAREPGPPE